MKILDGTANLLTAYGRENTNVSRVTQLLNNSTSSMKLIMKLKQVKSGEPDPTFSHEHIDSGLQEWRVLGFERNQKIGHLATVLDHLKENRTKYNIKQVCLLNSDNSEQTFRISQANLPYFHLLFLHATQLPWSTGLPQQNH